MPHGYQMGSKNTSYLSSCPYLTLIIESSNETGCILFEYLYNAEREYKKCKIKRQYIRGLSQNYPEKDYNFFNINGIHLIFYMQIEQFIRNIFAYFYDHG